MILPDELILVQNLTIDSIDAPITKIRALELVAKACDLKRSEISVSLGEPTSHRTQPVAAVTTKTLDETRNFLNNAGFNTRRFCASKPINGFSNAPVFFEDPTPRISIVNTKNMVVSSITAFTFILFITAVLFTVNPSKELYIFNQVKNNVTSTLLSKSTTHTDMEAKKPLLSTNTNYMSNIIYQPLMDTPEIYNKIFQPTTTSINDDLDLSDFHSPTLDNSDSNRNMLNPNLINLQKSTKRTSNIEKNYKYNNGLNRQLGNIDQYFPYNKYFNFYNLRSIIQTDYHRLIKPNLTQVHEFPHIGKLVAIRIPVKEVKSDLIINDPFTQPIALSLASIDHRNVKKLIPTYEQLNLTIGASFKNLSTITNENVSKLQNTDQLFDRIILTNGLKKQKFVSFNDLTLTPEGILEAKRYMPLLRPNLITKINVLKEPTLSSGAVTLSNNPLTRPALVMSLSQLNPDKVKIVAKATRRPSFPRRASVDNNATISNIIELNRTNLIGIFGTERNAIALIRLSSGRVIKVKVGDYFDGWEVLTIYKDKIDLANGKKQETLRLPG